MIQEAADGGPEGAEPLVSRVASLVERLVPFREALRGFDASQLLLRAAALTYLSIVSLIPLLTVGLMVLGALGLLDLRESVRTFIFDNLAVGVRGEVVEHLDRLVSNAGRGAAGGGLGAGLLVFSALLLLRNIEKAFDGVWGLHKTRTIPKQLLLYLGLLLAGPIALGLSLAVTTALKGWALIYGMPFGQSIFSMVPFALSVSGFVLIYKIAPAAKVQGRAAVIAGLIAASIWEAAKYGYAAYAVHAIRADSIYGPLAALPIFLVWIYVSWLIVLFGARLSFAIQHPELLRLASDPRAAARAMEFCAVRICLSCEEAGAIDDLGKLAARIRMPESMVREAAKDLEDAGLISIRGGVRLCREASSIAVGEVIQAVRGAIGARSDPLGQRLQALLEAAERDSIASLSVDLQSLRDAAEAETRPPLAST